MDQVRVMVPQLLVVLKTHSEWNQKVGDGEHTQMKDTQSGYMWCEQTDINSTEAHKGHYGVTERREGEIFT